ncbi:MAG: preprotein translocase subunit SecA [Thermincolia bacterium]
MLNKIIENFFNDIDSEVTKVANRVEEFDFTKSSQDELIHKTINFKGQLQRGVNLNTILPEAFAVVREAAHRVLGIRSFFVQVMGGVALHKGYFAEMKTGEGKTLTITMPAYLNALTGEGVHIVTTNEYLAKRDSDEMGKVFRFLGLTVGCLTSTMTSNGRQQVYKCDITYGSNSEFGFDYLRDNLVLELSKKVQRGRAYGIIDEVDSVLIDEARTPLIIADDTLATLSHYQKADHLARKLKKDVHFEVDYKEKTAFLTEEGFGLCEEYLGLKNLARVENLEIIHHLNQALKAHWLYQKDVDYVVLKGDKGLEVVIVDQFTGRRMAGRRYVDGLHQAIEVKEGVAVSKESKVVATITFQNYFRRYKKLAGLSGTLQDEAREFKELYGAEVQVIPINKPVIRKDFEDQIFPNEKAKLTAIVQDVMEKHVLGRPVLVGTEDIKKSEVTSQLLKEEGLPHVVLNAKTLEQEAEIIAQAGQKGAITVATNMAGRGTDIKLGVGVAELGGLHVIGTTRHSARRIDNQLRGRAGRQGDPGSSSFHVSLEDDLIQRYAPEDISNLSGKKLLQLIDKAQKAIESNNFALRKSLLEFDDIINKQRDLIYADRDRILAGENLKATIHSMIEQIITDIVGEFTSPDTEPVEWDLMGLVMKMHSGFRWVINVTISDIPNLKVEELKVLLIGQVVKVYEEKEVVLGSDQLRDMERRVVLQVMDRLWADHLDQMNLLRQGIGLQGYGRINPIQAYVREGKELFDRFFEDLRKEVVSSLFALKPETRH